MDHLWNDTPPSTPPHEEGPLGSQFRASGSARSDEPLDHRLPILGCLIVRTMHPRTDEHDKQPGGRTKVVLHFMALAVDPEYRRLGVAETLVGMATRKAGEVGAVKAGWTLASDSARSTSSMGSSPNSSESASAAVSTTTTTTASSSSSPTTAPTAYSSTAQSSHSPTGYFDDIHQLHVGHQDRQSSSSSS